VLFGTLGPCVCTRPESISLGKLKTEADHDPQDLLYAMLAQLRAL